MLSLLTCTFGFAKETEERGEKAEGFVDDEDEAKESKELKATHSRLGHESNASKCTHIQI